MILGDKAGLGFELEPVAPSWERRSLADLGPWARFSLYVRKRCLTKAAEADRGRVVEGVHVPLLPIADWLVRNIRAIAYEESPVSFRGDVNLHEVIRSWDETKPPGGASDQWEDERYEWYSRHFLLAGADGAMLPDLAFVRADGRLWVSWAHTSYSGARGVEYLEPAGMESVEWESALSAMGEFVAEVARSVRENGLDGPSWSHEPGSLRDALECSASEYIEWIVPGAADWLPKIGVDPASPPEQSVALQALRDMDLRLGREGLANSLRQLECETKQPSPQSALAEMRSTLGSAGSTAQVEAAGYDAARGFRAKWGLNGQPVSAEKLEAKLEELDVRLSTVSTDGQGNSMVVGSRHKGRALVVLFENNRMQKEWARRMEIARAIGHLLLDPETSRGAIGAASSWRAAGPRRRRSGAFAAELLLPTEGVEELVAGRDPGTPEVFEEIMDRFKMGARATAYHLWNQRLLLSPEDRDRLIDEFASG